MVGDYITMTSSDTIQIPFDNLYSEVGAIVGE